MRRRKQRSWTRYDLLAVCCALIMIWPNLAGKTAIVDSHLSVEQGFQVF